jgi:hypothetical protein
MMLTKAKRRPWKKPAPQAEEPTLQLFPDFARERQIGVGK